MRTLFEEVAEDIDMMEEDIDLACDALVEDDDCISRETVLLYLDELKESEPKHYGFILSLQRYLRKLSSVKPKADVDALINKIETEFSWSMYDDWGNTTSLHDGLVDTIRGWAERSGEDKG